jgi:hypothetical protein
VTESNVFKLSQPGTVCDPLTEVLRSGARSLLAQAIEAEVAAFLGSHADKKWSCRSRPAAKTWSKIGRGCLRPFKCVNLLSRERRI